MLDNNLGNGKDFDLVVMENGEGALNYLQWGDMSLQ
jgi:hypothetical protein